MVKYFLLLLPLLLAGCASKKNMTDSGLIEEYRTLDTLTVVASALDKEQDSPARAYQESAQRSVDLLHTRLDISVDWTSQKVLGNATLSLRAYARPQDSIVLDAVNMEIRSVVDVSSGKALDFQYDGERLVIFPRSRLDFSPVLTCRIEYTADPTRNAGGREQGMYFIDPLDTIPDLPTQLWTQGETQNNSRWFPTIDQPNERTTQEVLIRIEDKYTTLSNGVLFDSQKHRDGTRTDHWKMDLPHAPYLFMLAVGTFDVVTEPWEDIEVAYYVDPGYGPDAKEIFAHTPEMLSFFSDRLGFPFPWSRYAQIVVHQYISGAMENTTAVVYGDFVQHHSDDMLTTGENDDIVAHEMIHQWFGDLLTCESWANLAMNEGFANWGEYLWAEHKYGKDEGDRNRLGNLRGYLRSAARGIRPIIDYYYEDPDEMFDAHSYNKSSLVIHMLRKLLGDEVFFRGISQYLRDNAFSAVEVDNLRLSMEKASGRDLKQFFQQWFLEEGHPVVRVESNYDSLKGELTLIFDQAHNTDSVRRAFDLPVDVDIHFEDGSVLSNTLQLEDRSQVFNIPLNAAPAVVVCDPGSDLLWDMVHPKDQEEYAWQMKLASGYSARIEAADFMMINQDTYEEEELLLILKDPHWAVRRAGVISWSLDKNLKGKELMVEMLGDENVDSRVRLAIIYALGQTGSSEYLDIITRQLSPGAKNVYNYVTLSALTEIDGEIALDELNKLNLEDTSPSNIAAKAKVYSASGSEEFKSWYVERLDDLENRIAGDFFDSLSDYLSVVENPYSAIESVKEFSLTKTRSIFLRLMATRSLYNLYQKLRDANEEERDEERIAKVKAALTSIIDQEQDQRLLRRYEQFNLDASDH